MDTETEKQLEDIQEISLTQQDRGIIVFALGCLAAMSFRDAENKPNPLTDQAMQVARKFGVII